MIINTREEWLNFVAQEMQPLFSDLGYPLPKRVRASIGFTSSGVRSKHIGECWDKSHSDDGHFEIFIVPTLMANKEHMPIEVAAVLAHELVHACVGLKEGHGKTFRKVAKGIGLMGKMTATTTGPIFEQHLTPILAKAGPIPHAKLNKQSAEGEDSEDGSSIKKKQTKRHIKCICTQCGYTVRTSRKWIDTVGAPHCPMHGGMEVQEQDDGKE